MTAAGFQVVHCILHIERDHFIQIRQPFSNITVFNKWWDWDDAVQSQQQFGQASRQPLPDTSPLLTLLTASDSLSRRGWRWLHRLIRLALGRGMLDHGFQHLGGCDDRFPQAVGSTGKVFLYNCRSVSSGISTPQVAASNHYPVSGSEYLLEIIQRSGTFYLGYNEWLIPQLISSIS